MGYKRKATKKGDFKKKKSYSSRYNDKKVNTKEEVKIKAMIQRAFTKKEEWIIHRKLVLATPTSSWGSLIGRPLHTSMVELLPNSVFNFILTDMSGLTENVMYNQPDELRITALVAQLQCNLAFINYGATVAVVRASIIGVPNDSATTTAEPTLQAQPTTSIRYKGIFAKELKSLTTGTSRYRPPFNVIATKRFILRPMGLSNVSNAGGAGDPTISSRNTPYKEITLNKTYKVGKKLQFNTTSQNRPSDNYNYYLTITNDSDGASFGSSIRMFGVAGCRYRVKLPTLPDTTN